MRYFGNSLVVILAITLFSAPLAEAQGLFSALFGRNQASQAESYRPGKRVEIDISDQQLRAYEGDRLVLKTNVSTGRNNATPRGNFRAGWKHADHYSSLYHNAPMPWSVQVSGNIFIHGYTDVPRYPASHGCIRMPLTGRNPAKRFFNWVDSGTPIKIVP